MTEDEKVFKWLYDIRNKLIPYYYAIEKNRFKKNKFTAKKIMRKAYWDLYYTFPKLDEFINSYFKETIQKIESSFGIIGEDFYYQEQQAFDCEIGNIQNLHDNIDEISKKIAFMNSDLEDIREEEERQNKINALRDSLLKEKENIKVVVVGQYVWDDFDCDGGEISFRIALGKRLYFLYFVGKNDFLQKMFTCYNEKIGIKTEFLSDFAKKEVEDIFFNLLEKGNIKSCM